MTKLAFIRTHRKNPQKNQLRRLQNRKYAVTGGISKCFLLRKGLHTHSNPSSGKGYLKRMSENLSININTSDDSYGLKKHDKISLLSKSKHSHKLSVITLTSTAIINIMLPKSQSDSGLSKLAFFYVHSRCTESEKLSKKKESEIFYSL